SRLSVCRRLLFGLASPPLQLTQNAIGLYLNLFLLETARLRPILISAVMFSGRIVDAVSDPLIGFGVSRTRTRLGKCRPWLLAAAPLSALAFLLLWLPPRDSWGDSGKLAYFLPAYVAFSLAISCYYIPYTTLTIRISSCPADRDSATAYRMAFEMLGILLGPLFFTFIVEPKRTSVVCSQLEWANNSTRGFAGNNSTREGVDEEQAAYLTSAAAVSALVLFCGIAGFFGISELPDNVNSNNKGHQPEATHSRNDELKVKNSIRTYLVQCKRVVTYQPFLRATVIFITLSLSWHV
uniref:MFS domain-containing protein n=1 Tax=Macrostomum lignano TaxID=282301 RepID=A0A1I8IC70_9PLAT